MKLTPKEIKEQKALYVSEGNFKTSFQIEQLKLIAEREVIPNWVRELIKKYDKKANT